jgi:diguanylate cyclase (GGDEF)-like protein
VPADFLRTARDIAFCAHSILEPETVLEVEDTLQDPRFADNPMVQDVPHLRFYAGVPLLSPEGHPIGTLCVLDEKPNCLTEGARSGLISLARQASAQLELRRAVRELEAQTLSDSLTGAYNRRAFDRVLRDEWERHHRAASPLSLLLLDVDGFNHYIDNFGLQAGDAALQQITTAIQRPLQISNFVARYSGEQFAVVLQGTPTSAAAIVAEQIRESVNLQVWKNRSLTVSIGVASQQPTSELDRQTLVDRADHALYLAKQAGRNRVEIFKGWDHPLSNQHPLAGPVFIPYVPPASNPRGAA